MTMRRTVALCIEHGVAIGAHPSLPDLQGFGRREMGVSTDEVYAQTLYQIGALHAITSSAAVGGGGSEAERLLLGWSATVECERQAM